ncbi:MAG: peptidase M28, partial [Candidatus Sulfotelmatobacter sp.]
MQRFSKGFLKELQFFLMALGLALPSAAQSQGAGATAIEPGRPDARIVAALRPVSAEHIQANIDKLVSFGTRATISAQDPASIAAGRGIGAAREWIKAEFERYSQECGGCLEVKTDSFTEAPAARIPQPTVITNVYAV